MRYPFGLVSAIQIILDLGDSTLRSIPLLLAELAFRIWVVLAPEVDPAVTMEQ